MSEAQPNVRNRIVVGVDDSEGSRAALRWAIEEAAVRGARLDVVSAWEVPFIGSPVLVAATIDPALFEQGARQFLDEIVDQELGAAPRRPSEVHKIAAEGRAAEVLIDLSKEADLLVVGSRGRGGFRGLLLGSVSNQCVSHAHCPVAVIRAAA